jgi:hypothetical protein
MATRAVPEAGVVCRVQQPVWRPEDRRGLAPGLFERRRTRYLMAHERDFASLASKTPRTLEAPMRIGAILLVLWLVIGAIAAGQRNYYSNSPENCARTGTILVTIVAGPLNYVTGVNPKISCHFPQPSQ